MIVKKETMMSESEPTVFIVDGDKEVQGALRRLVESVRLCVETYSETQAFVSRHDPSRPGCLILEVRLRGMSGIELFRWVRRRENHIPVIFLTEHGDIPMAVQAIREGAFHFLQKPFNEQYLLDQIHAAIALDLQSRRAQEERRALVSRFENLSAREQEVLARIVAGKTNKAMAHQFGVAIKTVEFHRANIMRKVGVENVAELVCLLLRSGWDEQVRRECKRR
jgi:FixJ family two-component response regulator